MKTIIRVPLDQYAYIEQEFDLELSPEEAMMAYHKMVDAYKGGEGLNAKEIDALLDSYFKGDGVDSNQYDRLNPEQLKWVQAVKRSLARINYKSEEIE